MSKQILVFGDSIAYGAWDEEGGWVERLKCKIHKKVISSLLKFYCNVYNLSIDGDCIKDLLKRVEFEVRQRLIEEETIIIFAIGINDSMFIKESDVPIASSSEFKKDIEKVIQLSFGLSAKPVFVGLTPVDEKKTNPIPWSRTGKCYKNEYIKKYDDILRSTCSENAVAFVEIYGELIDANYYDLLFDGLHLNSKGHEKIYEIVSGYLEGKGII